MAQTMTRIQRTILLALQILMMFATLLPSTATHAEGAQPWYEVEIIVFANARESYRASENWKQDLILPQIAGARTLTPAGTPGSKAFQAVDPSRYRLQGEWSRLAASGEYHPLLHTAWIQPGLPEGQAVGVILESGAPSESLGGAKPLSGVVKVELSRYLHLDANLLYRKAIKGGAGADSAQPAFDTFQLSESRRMRSKEIHYLDHPMFGMIALITPLQ